MTLDADLLDRARTAEVRLIDAERNAEVARADFHHAVRRLQLAGGSLREIAEALSLSHQRVHQIVEGAGGSRPWRVPVRRRRDAARTVMPDPESLRCSFCGKYQKQVTKLIAGPGVFVCDECVKLAARVIATGEAAATVLSAVTPLGEDAAAATCSFCGKRRDKVPGLAGAAGGTICTECLALCDEIIAEEPG